MIFQISFDALTSPETLTEGLAITILLLEFMMLYTSLKLRSLVGMFGWGLMTIGLILAFISDITFLWFWLAVVTEVFILVLAQMAYTRASARQT